MANDYIEALKNARPDARALSDFISEPEDVMVDRRLALPIHTLDYYLAMMASEYYMKYVSANHTISIKEVNSFTMILVDAPTAVSISLPKMGAAIPAGRCINIGQETDNTVTLVPSTGVVVHPTDALSLRRHGSMMTLVYEGNDKWRYIGELP